MKIMSRKRRISRRALTMMLALVMALGMVMLPTSANATRTSVVEWIFPNNPPATGDPLPLGATQSATATPARLNTSMGNSTLNTYTPANGSISVTGWNWNAGTNPDFWTLNFSSRL